jgi:hypothetical protein
MKVGQGPNLGCSAKEKNIKTIELRKRMNGIKEIEKI